MAIPATPSDSAGSPVSGKANPVVFAGLTLLGGVLLVQGSFLPWVSVTVPILGQVSVNGLRGDGTIILVIGLVVIAVGAARLVLPSPRLVQRFTILAGAAAVIIAIADVGKMYAHLDGSIAGQLASSFVSPAMGIAVVVIGGVATAIGGLVVSPVSPVTEGRFGAALLTSKLRHPGAPGVLIVAGALVTVVVIGLVVVHLMDSTPDTANDAYVQVGYTPPDYTTMDNQVRGVCSNLTSGMSVSAAADAFAQGWTVSRESAETIVGAINKQGC